MANVRAQAASILLLTACGGRVEYDSPDGSAAGVTPPACPVCANHWLSCSNQNSEGVDFQVESQNDRGCAGYFYANQLATKPWTAQYMIICDPPQMCDDEHCDPVSLTADSFSWATGACHAEPG